MSACFVYAATPAQARQVLEAYIADINLLNANSRAGTTP